MLLRVIATCVIGKGDLLEEDELLIDQAMDDDVFGFLQRSVVAVSEFHTEVCVNTYIYIHICVCMSSSIGRFLCT